MTFESVASVDEARSVARLARQVFGPVLAIFVPRTPMWAIRAMDDDGELVGGVILKRLGRESGLVDFVFVHERARRRGLGPQLIDRGLAELDEAGCRHQFAVVRDDNTASWTMFATRGFAMPNIARLFFGFEPKAAGYSLMTMFALIGHSMWHRDLRDPAEPRVAHRGTGLGSLLLLSLTVAVLMGVPRGVDPFLLLSLPLVVGVALARYLVTWPFARAYGPVRFQVSHGGVPLALLNGYFGSWWPVLGMWVPNEPVWHESRYRAASGRASLAGWLTTLAALAVSLVIPDPRVAANWRFVMLLVTIFQALPVGPFQGLDGFRVLRWSRAAYVVGAALTIAVIVAVYVW